MDHKIPADIWYLISSRLSRKNSLILAKASKYLLDHLLYTLYRIVHLDFELRPGQDETNIATLDRISLVACVRSS